MLNMPPRFWMLKMPSLSATMVPPCSLARPPGKLSDRSSWKMRSLRAEKRMVLGADIGEPRSAISDSLVE